MSEIIGLFIFMVVFFAAGAAIAGVVGWVLSGENPEDTSSIGAFNNLADAIDLVLEDPGAYAYKERTTMYLGSKYLIVGFDGGSYTFSAVDDGLTSDDIEDIVLYKPNTPECENHCLCLYKYDDTDDWGEFDPNTEPLECRYFDDDVYFYTNYILDGSANSYVFGTSGIKNYVNKREDIAYLGDLIDQIVTNEFEKPTFYKSQYYFQLIGSPPNNVDPDFIFLQDMFIDVFDSSKLKDTETRTFVYILPYGEFLPDGDTQLWTRVERDEINARIRQFSKLRYKSWQEYSRLILSSERDADKMLYFLEYYQWADNDLLFDDNQLEDTVKSLGLDALEEVKDAVEKRILKCETYDVTSIKETCLKGYIDDCNTDSPTHDVYACIELMLSTGEIAIKPQELFDKLDEWIAELDPEGEIRRQIEEIKQLESDKKYYEAYDAYWPLIFNNYMTTEGKVDLDKIKASPDLIKMVGALELQADYENNELSISARSYGDGENKKAIYEVETSKDETHLAIPSKEQVIINNQIDLLDLDSIVEASVLGGGVTFNDIEQGSAQMENIYFTLKLLRILEGSWCIEFNYEDGSYEINDLAFSGNENTEEYCGGIWIAVGSAEESSDSASSIDSIDPDAVAAE